ncbi:tRNA methyltransferase complex GCD14 subunit, partial [Ancylostoma duodenale]
LFFRWGSRISATAGYVYALRPSAELWTRSLPRRTQILYTPDCSLILQLLDARPGSVICESGTGSGSLSHAIALAVAPSGHLYTHDIEESRTKKVEQEFKEHGLADVTTAVVQNVCTDGFFVTNACD